MFFLFFFFFFASKLIVARGQGGSIYREPGNWKLALTRSFFKTILTIMYTFRKKK
jgi:hypothetical protein